MHNKAFEQFKKQIEAGYKLMYNPNREVYDLAMGERQITQREKWGFELVEVVPTPPEAVKPIKAAEPAEAVESVEPTEPVEPAEPAKPKRRGRKPKAEQ